MIYETTDIKLAAVILCEIPGATLMGIDPLRLINSKKVLKIEYPSSCETSLNKLVDNYSRKAQLVNLYKYNKYLHLIRDEIFANGRLKGIEGINNETGR